MLCLGVCLKVCMCLCSCDEGTVLTVSLRYDRSFAKKESQLKSGWAGKGSSVDLRPCC